MVDLTDRPSRQRQSLLTHPLAHAAVEVFGTEVGPAVRDACRVRLRLDVARLDHTTRPRDRHADLHVTTRRDLRGVMHQQQRRLVRATAPRTSLRSLEHLCYRVRVRRDDGAQCQRAELRKALRAYDQPPALAVLALEPRLQRAESRQHRLLLQQLALQPAAMAYERRSELAVSRAQQLADRAERQA